MVDNLSASQRSDCMRAVRSRDTDPEMRVRRLAHSLGYRYALHRKSLPGKPDLVFVSRCKIIFVHGCFWHMHKCRRGRNSPATNINYWSSKREGNRSRDIRNIRSLREDGWLVLVIWECWTNNLIGLRDRLVAFLD